MAAKNKRKKISNPSSNDHKNVSEDVRAKLEEVIHSGFENKDPKIQAEWAKLFGKGNEPSVEEFLKIISNSLK